MGGQAEIYRKYRTIVAENANLTFEEMYSLLVQIEAVLNSRSLLSSSHDPNDLTPLTAAHFLVIKVLVNVLDADVTHIPASRLFSEYQRIQNIHQHFSKRWNMEYVNELKSREVEAYPRTTKSKFIVVDNYPPTKCCSNKNKY